MFTSSSEEFYVQEEEIKFLIQKLQFFQDKLQELLKINKSIQGKRKQIHRCEQHREQKIKNIEYFLDLVIDHNFPEEKTAKILLRLKQFEFDEQREFQQRYIRKYKKQYFEKIISKQGLAHYQFQQKQMRDLIKDLKNQRRKTMLQFQLLKSI